MTTPEVILIDSGGDLVIVTGDDEMLLLSDMGPVGPVGPQGEVGPSGPITMPDGGRAIWTRETDPGQLAIDGDIWIRP